MSVISNTERALSIATEHVDWAKTQGQTSHQVVTALRGAPMKWRDAKALTWPDAIDAVADAWRALA